MQHGAAINPQRRELRQHGTTLFPVGWYRETLIRHGIPWHWHEELEAVVVEKGTAVMVIDGQKHTIGQGTGVFLNAGVLHSAWSADGKRCVLRTLVFHPRLIGGVESIYWEKYLRPLVTDRASRWFCLDGSMPWHGRAVEAIVTAWEGFRDRVPGYEFLVRHQLSQLVFLVWQNSQQKQTPPPEKLLRDMERIKKMLQYIDEHLADELTGTAIAASAGLSESECLRCFRTMVNTTPIQYVKKQRLQRAAILLENTDWKISDIAAQCGFQEMSYFSKSFRQWTGCAPSAYRERANSEQEDQG